MPFHFQSRNLCITVTVNNAVKCVIILSLLCINTHKYITVSTVFWTQIFIMYWNLYFSKINFLLNNKNNILITLFLFISFWIQRDLMCVYINGHLSPLSDGGRCLSNSVTGSVNGRDVSGLIVSSAYWEVLTVSCDSGRTEWTGIHALKKPQGKIRDIHTHTHIYIYRDIYIYLYRDIYIYRERENIAYNILIFDIQSFSWWRRTWCCIHRL